VLDLKGEGEGEERMHKQARLIRRGTLVALNLRRGGVSRLSI